jgi:membrane fusion protein (multidrug efflux system)
VRPSTSSSTPFVPGPARSPGGVRRLAALVVAASCVLAAGCSGGAKEEETAAEVPTIAADVGKVTRQDIGQALTVRGTVAALPNEDVKISALVAGRVMALGVAEGDRVAQGQVVAEIDPQPLEDQRRQAAAAHESARAAVVNAQANLDRTERLLQKGIASGKEVEDAKLQLASAEAQAAQTKAALDAASSQVTRTKVVSPITGIVVKRLVNVGEQVDGTAAQPVLEVANVDLVELAANVPAEQLGKVRVKQPVTVRSDAYPDHDFKGEVLAIAPAVDPATNTALARVRIANPERLLKVGMFAQASVTIDEHKQALVVPTGAIAREGDETAVYVVSGDTATKTPVKVGIESPEVTEVLGGVTEGQPVLTSNVHGLGDKVKVAKSS